MSWIERGKSFIAELKRRKVFHVGSLYLIAAWGGSLGAAELFPAFGIPDWAVRYFVLAAMLGFPLALILAWAFEITPDGVVRDPGKSNPPTPQTQDTPTEGLTTTHWSGSFPVTVTLEGGEQTPQFFRNDFTIGRGAEAEVQIPEGKISRRHARVFCEQNRWYIEDLGSRNGTILNGHKIDGRVAIEGINLVTLYEGGATLKVHISTVDAETQLA